MEKSEENPYSGMDENQLREAYRAWVAGAKQWDNKPIEYTSLIKRVFELGLLKGRTIEEWSGAESAASDAQKSREQFRESEIKENASEDSLHNGLIKLMKGVRDYVSRGNEATVNLSYEESGFYPGRGSDIQEKYAWEEGNVSCKKTSRYDSRRDAEKDTIRDMAEEVMALARPLQSSFDNNKVIIKPQHQNN